MIWITKTASFSLSELKRFIGFGRYASLSDLKTVYIYQVEGAFVAGSPARGKGQNEKEM